MADEEDNQDDNWKPPFWVCVRLRWEAFKQRWLPFRTYRLLDSDDDFKVGPAEWSWRLIRKGFRGKQGRGNG